MKSVIAILFSAALKCSASLRQFKLELDWQKGSPDGFEREMVFINDQFPGPTLEVYQDDWVEVEVVNNLPFNTTLHWHGKYLPLGTEYYLIEFQALNS